eukprot:8587912-Pyramimonas_sp.AAC.1
MFLTGNKKYADKIVELLNLGKAKSSPTPIVTKLLGEVNEHPLSAEETKLYRQCVDIARYMVNYVTEVAFAVHVLLSKRLAAPTINDMKRLKHLG